ncbi:YxeA family protein [Haloimpatiens sp. FM7330]|uniref:YxeA family protein n=1 Tax=Haloimpatiens sp. FM7330 TaxID=3298610 RepID=UPI00363EEFF9
MKRKFKIIGSIFIILTIFIVCLGIAGKNNFLGMKRWGTKKYYVKIKVNGNKKLLDTKEGEKFPAYFYKMDAYNEDGNKIPVNFHSSKNLKLNAYLLIYSYSKNKEKSNSIESYEEVPADKVPTKAKSHLDK